MIGAIFVGGYYVGVKGERRSALNRWRPMLVELIRGQDIYRLHAFPTPPIMGLVLYPFAILPGKWAMTSWFAFKVILTMFALGLLLRMVDRTEKPLPAWATFLVLALSARPIVGDLLHGNVNLWVVFLIVVSLEAYRRDKDHFAGCLLGLAIASKLTPILLLGYFAWKRAWKVVAGCLLGLVLWLVIVPGAILGLGRNLALLESWGRGMVLPYIVEGRVETEQINQSLAGLWYRLATPSLAIKPDDGRAAISVNVLRLDPDTARASLRCMIGLLLVALAWVTRRPLIDRCGMRFLHEVGLVLIVMLLISERSWKHHYVTLLPTYAVLVASACWLGRLREGRPAAGLVWWMLGLSAILMTLTSKDIVSPLLGPYGSKLFQAYGAYVWAAILLAVGHVICLCRSELEEVRIL